MVNQYQVILALSCILLLGCAALVAGCSSGQAPSASPATPAAPAATTPGPSGGGDSVTIANFAFSPASLAVKSGSTVTWTNSDTAPHTIVADSGAFSSDTVATGGTYHFTFSQPGTYAYHCSIHPSMKGTVIVQP